jgi:hypothetical protein
VRPQVPSPEHLPASRNRPQDKAQSVIAAALPIALQYSSGGKDRRMEANNASHALCHFGAVVGYLIGVDGQLRSSHNPLPSELERNVPYRNHSLPGSG